MKLVAVWTPALQFWRPSGSHIAGNAKPLSWNFTLWMEKFWSLSKHATCFIPLSEERPYLQKITKESLGVQSLSNWPEGCWQKGSTTTLLMVAQPHFVAISTMQAFCSRSPLHAAGVVGRVPWRRLGDRVGLRRQPRAIHCPCHVSRLDWKKFCNTIHTPVTIPGGIWMQPFECCIALVPGFLQTRLQLFQSMAACTCAATSGLRNWASTSESLDIRYIVKPTCSITRFAFWSKSVRHFVGLRIPSSTVVRSTKVSWGFFLGTVVEWAPKLRFTVHMTCTSLPWSGIWWIGRMSEKYGWEGWLGTFQCVIAKCE